VNSNQLSVISREQKAEDSRQKRKRIRKRKRKRKRIETCPVLFLILC
jgi:hypothetical protein